MSANESIKWQRRGDARRGFTYEAVMGFYIVARAANTSQSSADDYPWSWWLTDWGVERMREGRKQTGSTATLRDAKDAINHVFGVTDVR